MLALELKMLAEQDLDSAVSKYCSSFGSATVLNVLPPRDVSNPGAIAVRMASEAEAEALAMSAGGSRCGTKVIIKLALAGNPMPAITQHNGVNSSTASPIPDWPSAQTGFAVGDPTWLGQHVHHVATVPTA